MAFSVEIQSELDGHLLPWPDVSARKMFGALVYMVDGKMFAIVHDQWLAIKVPQDHMAQLLEEPGARPFSSRQGIRFGDWVQLPLPEPAQAAGYLGWLDRSYQRARAARPSGKARASRSRR